MLILLSWIVVKSLSVGIYRHKPTPCTLPSIMRANRITAAATDTGMTRNSIGESDVRPDFRWPVREESSPLPEPAPVDPLDREPERF